VAHGDPVYRDRVAQRHVRAVVRGDASARRQKLLLALRRRQTIGNHFLEAKLHEQVFNTLFTFQFRVVPLGRQRVAHLRFRYAVVAVYTTDLFDQIVRPLDIQAMVRRRHQQAVACILDGELQRFQHFPDLVFAGRDAANAGHFGRRQLDGAFLRRVRVIIDDAFPHGAAGQSPHQFRRALRAEEGLAGMHAPAEAESGLGVDFQGMHAAPDVDEVPGGRLQQDVGRAVGNLTLLAAHDTTQTQRPCLVGDQNCVVGQIPRHAVQRRQLFALLW